LETTVTSTEKKLTLAEVQARLQGKTGKRYWRSLDELAETDEFGAMLNREFPRFGGEWTDAVSRRSFMKLAGAGLALAGLTGCTKQPDEMIYPYVKQPEDLVLGKPMYFATAMPFITGAQPLLVKSDAFRPIKVDGNPDHPLVRGGSDPIAQGSLLDLYDPDRSQHVQYRGNPTSYGEFLLAFTRALEAKQPSGGDGIAVVTSTVTSPTLAAQIKQAQTAYPRSKWYQWDPVNRDAAMAASKAVFGSFKDAQYKLDDADVILALDSDFLSGIAQPGFTALARQWARRRKLELDPETGLKTTEMNRLYAVESVPTTTGFKADHRLALSPSQLEAFAYALAGMTGAGGMEMSLSPDAQAFAAAVAKELKANGGKCVVIAGDQTSVAVQSAAIAINQALGNVGKTVFYTDTVNPMPTIQADGIREMAADLQSGKTDLLVLLDANLAYTGPVDLNFPQLFGDAIRNGKTTIIHLGSHRDETADFATWHVPGTHYLETWSDGRAYDGTVTIMQPLIAPMYDGHSQHEIVQAMLENPYVSAQSAVRANWPQLKDDAAWRAALHQGWVDGTAFPTSGAAGGKLPAMSHSAPADGTIQVVFRPDPSIWDGRYANVGWLQELPKPLTNMSWDNAALLGIPLADKLGVEEADVIEITVDGHKVKAPVLLAPGAAEDTIVVYLGHGREGAGRAGSGVGFNAYGMRTSSALVHAAATVRKTGDTYEVCITKSHYTDHRSVNAAKLGNAYDENRVTGHGPGSARPKGAENNSLEGDEAADRAIIRWATVEEYKKEPNFAQEGSEMREAPSKDDTLLYPYDYAKDSLGRAKYAWAMAIDQNSCIGCNACIVSCYAENNIPVVGRHQVKTGRDMQWLRIDNYYEGDLDAPKAHFQPMMCQHCENAGCEQVCPVGATIHSPEGLNVMVYNRCVGTRYCSNNCPYKVRRFNWLLYSDYDTESLKFMRNPDVSVRSRGVMEKCTYCVQRIAAAKIEADKENRAVRDGDIETACQQACPTNAIMFGDINDPNSRVSKRKQSPRSYAVLGDIGYRPRTTYIAEVLNPNPDLMGSEG
jgi:molybdopterin-containing oxidoreductase family iron-sulfur binding subunit